MKSNLMRLIVLLIFISTGILNTHAAEKTNTKIPIYVESQCNDDAVGSRMAYRIKEEIRFSSRMTIATKYTDSVLQLNIICLTPDQGERGIISQYAYSVTALNSDGHYDYQITFGVGSCGSNRVSECAERRVAGLDESIDDLAAKIRDGKFKYGNQ